MDFEVRGKILNMEMPNTWKCYPEGLLVLPENSHVSFYGEMYDQNSTPIDVTVMNSPVWGGYVVRFRNYAMEESKNYQKFGVFTTEEIAIYVARMILLCNRVFQYNWRGLNQIILYGEKFDLDIVASIAFLHMMFPKITISDILINPQPNDPGVVTNPIVLVEHREIDWKNTDSIEAKGIARKTRSYTRLLMMHYLHHMPGISFFNVEAFIDEVMQIIETGDGDLYPRRWFWDEARLDDMIRSMENKLTRIYKKYSDGTVPTEYLATMVERDTIVAPGYANPITNTDEEKKEEASDEA